jgi:hypothetical protein
MSLLRIVPLSLFLAALLGPEQAEGQYQQPWVGRGIPSGQGTGHNQILVAQQSKVASAPVRTRSTSAPARVAKEFTIRVENISKGEALKLSNGAAAAFVSAPVLWVIHTGSTSPIFTGGERDKGMGLELLAETGNPGDLVKSLTGRAGIVAVGGVATPVGATAEGPLEPGQGYEFRITAEPGQLLSTAWMFGQSNDLFYANERPIALFDAAGNPKSGDMTAQLSLWDAGTEVNEEPGFGPNQGPRQKTPEAGIEESQGIAHVQDRFRYPPIAAVLRMTITPVGDALSGK